MKPADAERLRLTVERLLDAGLVIKLASAGTSGYAVTISEGKTANATGVGPTLDEASDTLAGDGPRMTLV